LRIRSQIGSHRTGGAAGDDNVWRPPARSGYEAYMERTGQTPDRFMKQFGRGGAGGGYAPSQPVRFNQPAQELHPREVKELRPKLYEALARDQHREKLVATGRIRS
jgi:hypothetical protein